MTAPAHKSGIGLTAPCGCSTAIAGNGRCLAHGTLDAQGLPAAPPVSVILAALQTQEGAAHVTRTRALVSSTSYTTMEHLTAQLVALTGQGESAVRSALWDLVGQGVLLYRQAVGVRWSATRAARGVS